MTRDDEINGYLYHARDKGRISDALRIFEEETGIEKPMPEEVSDEQFDRILVRLRKDFPMSIWDRMIAFGPPVWLLPALFFLIVMTLFLVCGLKWR